MASNRFDVIFSPNARAFYNSLDALGQAEVTRIIALITLDPWIDGVTKFEYVSQVVVLTAYDDGDWVILYRILDDRVIQLWAIERADPERRRRRRY